MYDDTNNKLTVVDETGVKTVTKWNPLGWKLEDGIDELGVYKAKGKYGYDSYGRVSWSEDALANRTLMQYDAWSRQTTMTYADLFISELQYDDIANTKTSIDPELNKFRETFDKLGRTTKKEEMKPTVTNVLAQYVYDVAGNVKQTTDAKGYITTYNYDIQSRLTSVINPKLEETKYTYSMVGDLTEIKYPDLKTVVKQYDEIGRLIKKTDPKLQVSTYYYDANSNLLKQIDRKGKQFDYEYTNRNLLWKKKILNQPNDTITFGYDDAGRRTSMIDGTGTTAYTYKPMTGELNKVTYPDSKTIQYVYDAAGNRKQMTDPFGVKVYYSYDARNRLNNVGLVLNDFEASYTYFKNGLLKTIQQRNGNTSNYTYDGMNLDTLLHKKADGTILNSYDYNYDANRNQDTKIENGVSSGFTYDVLNRIATSGQFSETYGYDNRGNRQTMQSNQPLNLQDNQYVYDDRDQLTRVTTQQGKIVDYKYNGDGLLYERTENGATTRYYYDGSSVIAEGTVTGGIATLKARYIRGSGGLIAQQDSSQNKSYYLSNGHGDIVELRDSAGNTRLNQYTYDIWGNPTLTKESISNPFRYSGELWDTTTSLQYLRARWYDPSDGRFINEDSYEGDISNPLSLNLYTYVNNNPLMYSDPTGFWAQSVTENWMINDQKLLWITARDNNDKNGMANAAKAASDLRERMRKNGVKEIDIMQSADAFIPENMVLLHAKVELKKDLLWNVMSFVASFWAPDPEALPIGTLKGPDVKSGVKLLPSVTSTASSKIDIVLDHIKRKNGAPPPGYVGGSTYKNKSQALSTKDTYKEYDINPKIPGVNRGQERIVIGSNGNVWYTNDHYENFIQIK